MSSPINLPQVDRFRETSRRDAAGRRSFLRQTAAWSIAGLAGSTLTAGQQTARAATDSRGMVRTVLGPVSPAKLGVTLMHEHAPTVDWSELYETPVAPIAASGESMLATTVGLLDAFHKALDAGQGPGAIVECTPIRVGRYPRLLVELAKRTPVHIIACTGFWCEAFAPQHPWAVRLGVETRGVKKLAALYIREINEGMEDPSGAWGKRFTDVKVGMINCATSTLMRPSERRCHEAAAIASRETGCPITTHTTDGGGLEEAQLFVKHGAKPEKVIIGHQGHQDDRANDEANEYHRRITALGCNVQFDRVGHTKYSPDKVARQIKYLVDAGFAAHVLVSHDHVPHFYTDYTAAKKSADGWKVTHSDYTVVPTQLVKSLRELGVSAADIRAILVENPQRVLPF